MSCSLERKLLDAQETSARRKRMKKETTEVRQLWTLVSLCLQLALCQVNRRERMLRRQASFAHPGGGGGAQEAEQGQTQPQGVERSVEQSTTTDAFI